MALILTEHYEYVSDAARVAAFSEAIRATVRPGDVVVDLGAGTGILGLLSCRAGARRVYAIEHGDIIAVARDLARANGVADRYVFVKEHSTHVELPERADVLVADAIGRFGFEAGLLGPFLDARDRFLRAGGRLIPSNVRLYTALVADVDERNKIDFWAGRPHGFDFGPARRIAANTGYPLFLTPAQLASEPVAAATIEAATASTAPIAFDVELRASRHARIAGIGGWFVAELAPGVTMTNGPLGAAPIRRRQVFFPVDCGIELAPGDAVRARLNIRAADAVVTWTVTAAGRTFRHSTMNGMLLWGDEVRRTNPDYVPRLSRWGVARASVLALCDGRPLRDVERGVLERHPDLFPTRADAERFVAEVVTRYCE